MTSYLAALAVTLGTVFLFRAPRRDFTYSVTGPDGN
jgi:hypothetical protein